VTSITENMKLTAADAIAQSISDGEHIMPSVFDKSVSRQVDEVVAAAATADGVTRS
jgi:malic enzyme